jgi:predicted dienelactone hydrolase
MRKLFRQALRLSCITGISSLLISLPGGAAERIQFFYGPVEPTIYVDDIQHFADTGEVRGSFRLVASRLDASQLDGLRSLLNHPFNLDVATVSELTYSPVGERLLRHLGELVQTDSQQNGFSALRASLILAAADDAGLTIMNFLQQYPLDTLQLNYALAQELLRENQAFFQQRDAVVTDLRSQAQAAAIELSPALQQTAPHLSGSYAWSRTTFTFENPLRQTPPIAHLYLPAVTVPDGTLPLVVISHGAASDRATFDYLASHLAFHGYAVVTLDHEDNAAQYEQFLSGLAQPPNPITLISRPRDITAALDALEAMAQTNPDLRRLNFARVGVIGQSLGGYTALAVAGATLNPEALRQACPTPIQDWPSLNLSMLVQCDLLEAEIELPTTLRDERVSSVIAINPLTSHIFGPSGLAQVTIPVMVISGTDDYFTPALPEQIEPFDWLASADKFLVVMQAGTHFSFLGGNVDSGALPLPEGLVGPPSASAYPYLQGLSVAFFDRYQRGQSRASAYLNQGYLDTFAQSPFQFSILYGNVKSSVQP